jgi:hypothetical protein
MDERKPHIVIFPLVQMGNLTPLFEFSKLLASHHDVSVIFIIAIFMATPPQSVYMVSGNLELGKYKGLVKNSLKNLLNDSSNHISSFITNTFNTTMLNVSTKSQIPIDALCNTRSTSNNFLILYHSTINVEMKESLKDLEGLVKALEVPSMLAKDFPDLM